MIRLKNDIDIFRFNYYFCTFRKH